MTTTPPFTNIIKENIQQFLIDQVNNPENYPVVDNPFYSRNHYAYWTEEHWKQYFESLYDLCKYIRENNLLRPPSELIPEKDIGTGKLPIPAGKIYRAAKNTRYDKIKKIYIPLPGKSQPIWFAVEEKVAFHYHQQTPQGTGMLNSYTLKDQTKSGDELYLLNLDGPLVPKCTEKKIHLLNVELLKRMYAVVEKQIDILNPYLYTAYGLIDIAIEKIDRKIYDDRPESYKEMIGTRWSSYEIDRIVVIEFMIILKIVEMVLNEWNDNTDPFRVILGYYHSNVSVFNMKEQVEQQHPDKCIGFPAEVVIDSEHFDKSFYDNSEHIVDEVVELHRFYTRKSVKSKKRKLPTGGKKTNKRKTRKTRNRLFIA